MRYVRQVFLQYQRAIASTSRIAEVLDTHVEIQDRPGARSLLGVRDEIEFREVPPDSIEIAQEARSRLVDFME
jgi:ABC-type multidrug transport system fused ATPase/permease subunit